MDRSVIQDSKDLNKVDQKVMTRDKYITTSYQHYYWHPIKEKSNRFSTDHLGPAVVRLYLEQCVTNHIKI